MQTAWKTRSEDSAGHVTEGATASPAAGEAWAWCQPRPCAGPRERGTMAPTAKPERNKPTDQGDLCEAARRPGVPTGQTNTLNTSRLTVCSWFLWAFGFHLVVLPAFGSMTRKDPSPGEGIALKHLTLHSWKSELSETEDGPWVVPCGPGLSLPGTLPPHPGLSCHTLAPATPRPLLPHPGLSRHSPPKYTRRAVSPFNGTPVTATVTL